MERERGDRESQRDDDTSGGPLSGGAGEGSGQDAEDAPDVDVPGGADGEGTRRKAPWEAAEGTIVNVPA